MEQRIDLVMEGSKTVAIKAEVKSILHVQESLFLIDISIMFDLLSKSKYINKWYPYTFYTPIQPYKEQMLRKNPSEMGEKTLLVMNGEVLP